MDVKIREHNLGNYVIPEDVMGGVCVDIGSNVGSFFSEYHNFFSKIHYYEPYKPCYEVCKSKQKKYDNVMGFNEAVLDKKNNFVEIVSHYDNDSGSNAINTEVINSDWNIDSSVGISSSVDLEIVLSRVGGNIDYLKCDCETSEYYIFYGKDLKNIKYIALELHWQMGEKKYYEVLDHILKTHDLISCYPGDTTYIGHLGGNKELLFKRKNLKIKHDCVDDFEKFKHKLINDENFSYIRFSDGEMFVINNRYLELGDFGYNIAGSSGYAYYGKEEQKLFDPEKHSFYRERLVDSLSYNSKNYYKGLPTRSQCIEHNFDFDELLEMSGGDSEFLTFADLLNTINYRKFIKEIVPLFSSKKVIMIVNEVADIDKLPFEVIKDFRVGSNCFINNYDIIEKIKSYINNNDIKNHVFLVSAASLSNVIIHQLYDMFSENTYIDIGSTLNPIMGMSGWIGTRTYLREYWDPNFNSEQKIIDWKPVW